MILKHLYDLQEHDAFIYDGCLFVFDCVSVVDADECFAVNMASHCLVILPSATVVDVITDDDLFEKVDSDNYFEVNSGIMFRYNPPTSYELFDDDVHRDCSDFISVIDMPACIVKLLDIW